MNKPETAKGDNCRKAHHFTSWRRFTTRLRVNFDLSYAG